MKTEIGIHFGALAPKLCEQLKDFEFDSDNMEHFQKDADAITRLAIRGIIPDSMKRSAQKRLFKRIVQAVQSAN